MNLIISRKMQSITNTHLISFLYGDSWVPCDEYVKE